MSEYEELLEALLKKYMDEGMSEFDARMKAVMSQEAVDMVYPGLKKIKDNESN
jgi:hypothetical protein|tara:strand:- start:342 stop:500 length:159 start_codon:yes stop_codon:yes gene_type:complete